MVLIKNRSLYIIMKALHYTIHPPLVINKINKMTVTHTHIVHDHNIHIEHIEETLECVCI